MEIPIFGFKKYWQTDLNLMELNMSPTFKNFLQSETVNADKNKSYYQKYDVKTMRALHNQAIIKHKIYENILARKSGMDYSPVIRLKKVLWTWKKQKQSPQ